MSNLYDIDVTLVCIAENLVELEESLNVTNLTLSMLVKSNERIAYALEELAGIDHPEE